MSLEVSESSWERDTKKAELLLTMKEKEALKYKLLYEEQKKLFEDFFRSSRMECKRLVKILNDQITKTQAEVELANEKINNQSTRLQESDSSIAEKDTEIIGLKYVVDELKSVSAEMDKEISRLQSDLFIKSQEVSELLRQLEVLRMSSDSATVPQERNNDLTGTNVMAREILHHSSLLRRGSKSLKRKAVETALNTEVLSSHGTLPPESILEDCRLSKKRATAVTLAAEETLPSDAPTLDWPRRSERIAAKRAIGVTSASEAPEFPIHSKRITAKRATGVTSPSEAREFPIRSERITAKRATGAPRLYSLLHCLHFQRKKQMNLHHHLSLKSLNSGIQQEAVEEKIYRL